MGAKAKRKAVMKNLKKASAQFSTSKDATPDFLPLEGGPARDLPKVEDRENKATVLYIGRIPHGFYENEMEAFFKQFGTIKRLRIARNRKVDHMTGRKSCEECMHNYLMYEHLLQVHLVPPAQVHPKLWKGVNRWYQPLDWVQIERKRHDKERTLEQQQKLVAGIMRRDQKRRKRIEAAGIHYECPEIVGCIQPTPKKIKFDEE
ncbi:putative RNA-binding protein [Sesamum angolense]|uniref:RNA-binding protein n=1 Tax=Sesamum angolense TaxID=2727404 RepID=A0AAE2C0A6_9LAMI|nr:putative RNA-binding protein [Sesamum angolense]